MGRVARVGVVEDFVLVLLVDDGSGPALQLRRRRLHDRLEVGLCRDRVSFNTTAHPSSRTDGREDKLSPVVSSVGSGAC